MRRLIFLAALLLAACGNGSADAPGIPGTGSGPARSYAVADFTGVAATGSDNVEVATGTGFSVRAEGDPAELDRLRITKEGSTLKIGRINGVHWGLGRSTKVFVTMPRISSASLTGSGDITVDHVEGDRFDGNISGSGDLTVRAVKVGALSLSSAGSGDMALTGQARSLKASVAGSGNIDARHLQVSDAAVDIAGSGDVHADVRGSAKVSLVGSGDVNLGDAARCSISKMGSGSVRCGR